MSTPESNGRGPAAADDTDEILDDDPDFGVDDDKDLDEESLVPQVALTPRQILGGFVLLAALLLVLRRLARRRPADP